MVERTNADLQSFWEQNSPSVVCKIHVQGEKPIELLSVLGELDVEVVASETTLPNFSPSCTTVTRLATG